VKLLLTSGGVTNPSIERALVDLLGRPMAECTGGDAAYLAHWMRASGLADLLSALPETVCGRERGQHGAHPPDRRDLRLLAGRARRLGARHREVLAVSPPDLFPQNTTAHAEQWAAELGPGARCFVVDDETALVVVDGRVEVVSEGVWRELSAD